MKHYVVQVPDGRYLIGREWRWFFNTDHKPSLLQVIENPPKDSLDNWPKNIWSDEDCRHLSGIEAFLIVLSLDRCVKVFFNIEGG